METGFEVLPADIYGFQNLQQNPHNGLYDFKQAQSQGTEAMSEETDGLEWKNGIGTLPGSNLRFRRNEYGVIEVLMEDIKEVDPGIQDLPSVSHLQLEEKFNPDAYLNSTGQEDVVTDLSMKPRLMIKNVDNPHSQDNRGGNSFPVYQPAISQPDERYVSQTHHPGVVTAENSNGLGNFFVSHETAIELDNKYTHANQYGNRSMPPLTSFMQNGNANHAAKFLSKAKLKHPNMITGPAIPGKSQVFNFSWNKYLKEENAIPVPENAFEEVARKPAFPKAPNKFVVGDLLESVDPLHQSIIAAVSVAEVKGFRMRLHFEGYSTLHDFWVNADDPLIFSCGFCKETGKKLHPPKAYNSQKFQWRTYSKQTGKNLATTEKFHVDLEKYKENLTKFDIGDKLEAVDRKNPSLICVATVIDIMGELILIHFDGWNHNYDYWCDATSNYIHPVGWCKQNDKNLAMPQDMVQIGANTWEAYLRETKSKAAREEAFQPKTSHGFEIGMKLEVVDKRNPILVRVATIAEKTTYQVKIHFDGWDLMYDYWIDVDSPTLHPVGWCERTRHPLHPNITDEDKQPWQSGCPIPGCRGMGHIKGSKFVGHHSEYGCPYSPKNLDSYPIQDRIAPRRGPKPSSLLRRRIANATSPQDIPSVNEHDNHDKLPSGSRRPSRSSVSSEKKSDPESDLSDSESNGTGEPPPKRINHENRPERTELHYSVNNSPLWSSVPNKEVAAYWDQCTRQSTGTKNVRASEVCKWSSQDVAQFVKKLTGQEKHAEAFLIEEIDGEAFLLLSQNDISRVLNIKLGPTLKIHSAIVYARANE